MDKLKGIIRNSEKRERLLKVIAIVNIFSLLISNFFIKEFEVIIFINLLLLVLIEYILFPLSKQAKENTLKDRNVWLKVTFKAIMVLVLFLSVYRMFYTKNYDLKYTYFLAAISFLIILVEVLGRNILENYRDREEKEFGKFNLAWSILLSLAILVFIANSIYQKITIAENQLVLDNIKEPSSITINIVTDESYNNAGEWLFDNETKSIEDPEQIKTIVDDLASKTINNASGIAYLNYQRMEDDRSNHYVLWFDYGDQAGEKQTLEAGYISSIILNSNGQSLIEELKFKKGLIYEYTSYYDKYPVELSKESKELIYSYVD